MFKGIRGNQNFKITSFKMEGSAIVLRWQDHNCNQRSMAVNLGDGNSVFDATKTLLVQTSGNGGSLTISFPIPGGFAGIPIVQSGSSDADDFYKVTVDGNNVIVHYELAPPQGTNNLLYSVIYNETTN